MNPSEVLRLAREKFKGGYRRSVHYAILSVCNWREEGIESGQRAARIFEATAGYLASKARVGARFAPGQGRTRVSIIQSLDRAIARAEAEEESGK